MSTFGCLDSDLRWFCARMKAMAPDLDIPHDMGGLTDREYVFYDEEHNINYTLLRHSDIFRIETEVTLPPVGGEVLWNAQTSRLRAWCETWNAAIAVESNICPNGQIGMLELRMDKSAATLECLGSLRRYIVMNICSDLTSYGERYVGVKYEETGHLFYAYLRGFDISKALLVREHSIEFCDCETHCFDKIELSEEMRVSMEMNRIDMIEPENIISGEVFRKAWECYVFAADIRVGS